MFIHINVVGIAHVLLDKLIIFNRGDDIAVGIDVCILVVGEGVRGGLKQ